MPDRCATSGRLTPAAATLTRISPGPGAGTARVSGTSTSGPPGLLMPMTVICAGSFSMVFPCETPGNQNKPPDTPATPRLATASPTVAQGEEHMATEDDDKPRKKI